MLFKKQSYQLSIVKKWIKQLFGHVFSLLGENCFELNSFRLHLPGIQFPGNSPVKKISPVNNMLCQNYFQQPHAGEI